MARKKPDLSFSFGALASPFSKAKKAKTPKAPKGRRKPMGGGTPIGGAGGNFTIPD